MPKRKDGLYKRPRSSFWWANYIDGSGRRTRKSTQTSDRREAEAVLGKWKSEAFQERLWGKTSIEEKPRYSFDEVLLSYLNAKRVTPRFASTAKHLYESFSGSEMTELTDLDVKAYIRARQEGGAAPGTINKEIGMLSSAINYARSEYGWNLGNPAQGKRLREPEGIIRWITREEAERLIEAAAGLTRSPCLADFIRLALNTGCRSGELLGLEWNRVDLKNDLFILESEHQKSRRRGSVPLNEEARAALLSRANFRATYCPDSPWVFCQKNGDRMGSVKKGWATACKLAGIENFRIHDQRHTLASWLVMENVPLYTVSKVLRHSTVKMTERYAHLNPENLREAVCVLDSKSHFGHTRNSNKSKVGG